MPEQVSRLKRHYEALKRDRANWEGIWESVAEVMWPNALGFEGQRTPGDRRTDRIVDATGQHALETLAAALHGTVSNPASDWFAVRAIRPELNKLDPVREYLSEVKDVMRQYMYAPGSGLTTALHESYMNIAAFGTAAMWIGERRAGGLMFQARALSECLIAENSEGAVDTLYRQTRLTARQIMQEWPDTAPKRVKDLMRDTPEKSEDRFEVIHAVYPRSDRDPTARGSENMAFASCYFMCEDDTLLEESGVPEFPYAVPRWSKAAGEIYGRSPGMTALPDVRMLQEMEKTNLKGAMKIVDPPLQVPNDGFVGPIRTSPGGIIHTINSREIIPLQVGGNGLPIALEMTEQRRDAIRRSFFTDILQIVTDREMTATEVQQRTAERMRMLGPILGRLESELLGPMIARVYGVLSRAGLMPEPPQEMADQRLTVEYVSPLARAQRASDADALSAVVQHAMPFIQAKPELIDRFEADRIIPWLADIFGVDPDLVTDDADWEAAEAQRNMMQAMASGAQGMADVANKGAGAVDKLASAQQKGADVAGMMEQMGARPQAA